MASDITYVRSLIEVQEIDTAKNTVRLYIPQWSSDRSVVVPLGIIPETLRSEFRPDYFFIAEATIDVDDPAQMKLRNYESPICQSLDDHLDV